VTVRCSFPSRLRGEQLYQSRCAACHSLDANRIGPMHRGVYGRKVGSVPGFDYSPAVRKSKLQWSEKTLDQWLTDPEGLIVGQKMGYRVAEAADRSHRFSQARIEEMRQVLAS
jgi:cytochrome c